MHLARPSLELEQAYLDYISEWENSNEKIVPYAARREGMSFSDLLSRWEYESTENVRGKGFVPASLFFYIDDDRRIVGALHIRHELNEYLLHSGGHIGYGIRPKERLKGHAAKMLEMSLPLAKQLGLEKVLVCCDKVNTGSAKTIIKNGGVLENEVITQKEVVQRYWINIGV